MIQQRLFERRPRQSILHQHISLLRSNCKRELHVMKIFMSLYTDRICNFIGVFSFTNLHEKVLEKFRATFFHAFVRIENVIRDKRRGWPK